MRTGDFCDVHVDWAVICGEVPHLHHHIRNLSHHGWSLLLLSHHLLGYRHLGIHLGLVHNIVARERLLYRYIVLFICLVITTIRFILLLRAVILPVSYIIAVKTPLAILIRCFRIHSGFSLVRAFVKLLSSSSSSS